MRTATPTATDRRTRLRLAFLAAVLLSLLLVLVARLWYVQVVAGERYGALAEQGRARTMTLEAPRGRILDRHGRPLVDNRMVHVVGVRPDELGASRDRVVSELAQLLGRDPDDLADDIAAGPIDPLRPVPVAFDVPERTALYLWEHQSTRFPGVHTDLVPRRAYPHGALAAHVVGYPGEITADQLDDPAYRGYRPGVQVGQSGVERIHEPLLRGTEGRRRVEVDASGHVARQRSEQLPVAGADVTLTLDLDVQRLAETALADGIARARATPDEEGRNGGTFAATGGAVVVLDPGTGEILASASSPTYAPEAFVGGIAPEEYDRLLDPARRSPLVNRVIHSTSPPGSVFKTVSTAAALRHGVATSQTTLPCPPRWRWRPGGRVYRNWTPDDPGELDLVSALAQSCDTVYYELAKRMWLAEEAEGAPDHLGDEARRFGYGAATGVDLPGERPGVVPGRVWRRATWLERREGYCTQAQRATDDHVRRLLTELCGPDGALWRGGDAVNLSIGQGDLLVTPLQVAVSTAAIANGGTLPWPHVTRSVQRADGAPVVTSPRDIGTIGLDDTALDTIRQGLREVTRGRGTAADAFAGVRMTVAGKSGTAESPPGQPDAWFAGYAPHDDPSYVVVAVIEEGGSGSGVAAPVVRAVVDGLAELERATGPTGAAR